MASGSPRAPVQAVVRGRAPLGGVEAACQEGWRGRPPGARRGARPASRPPLPAVAPPPPRGPSRACSTAAAALCGSCPPPSFVWAPFGPTLRVPPRRCRCPWPRPPASPPAPALLLPVGAAARAPKPRRARCGRFRSAPSLRRGPHRPQQQAFPRRGGAVGGRRLARPRAGARAAPRRRAPAHNASPRRCALRPPSRQPFSPATPPPRKGAGSRDGPAHSGFLCPASKQRGGGRGSCERAEQPGRWRRGKRQLSPLYACAGKLGWRGARGDSLGTREVHASHPRAPFPRAPCAGIAETVSVSDPRQG